MNILTITVAVFSYCFFMFVFKWIDRFIILKALSSMINGAKGQLKQQMKSKKKNKEAKND